MLLILGVCGIGGIISFIVLDPFQLSSIELVDKRGNQKGVNETNQRPFFYEYEQKTEMGPKQ